MAETLEQNTTTPPAKTSARGHDNITPEDIQTSIPAGAKFAILSAEQKRFVRWQIKTLLRMVHELREQYGITDA
jgi:hypothetical protein